VCNKIILKEGERMYMKTTQRILPSCKTKSSKENKGQEDNDNKERGKKALLHALQERCA
jgi:hypothetical protein